MSCHDCIVGELAAGCQSSDWTSLVGENFANVSNRAILLGVPFGYLGLLGRSGCPLEVALVFGSDMAWLGHEKSRAET
ncbi:hypothetical protein FNV43_RR13109 [Rhamnella rubrinervis]|uniref:Uncharacterized protein n=1 Tax=Rhamnella rubrinervis TaxID=2594499 RepID=A0A8K0H0H4_9ROSA|nr:hypothetical protein FNV43_RR13109 [Rhamnella rubrinervis]